MEKKECFIENIRYRFFNNGMEFTVISHKMKTDLFVVSIGKMKMLVHVKKDLSLMTVIDYGLGNELVNVDTTHMLHDTPRVQHGALENENILDCRERDPLVLIAYVKKTKLSFYLESACLVSCL